jgi:RNA polymerase sigma factor (TIGR02999 family)
MANVTQILERIETGDPRATEELLPVVYHELRRLAAQQLQGERAGHTLNPTALVHEAYLRLVAPGEIAPQWNSRGHFFAAAAQAMRRILVESARQKAALKRGGDRTRVPLDEARLRDSPRHPDLIALDDALSQLEDQQPQLAQLVNLRYFAGLTMPQAAEALDIPLRTAERNWTYAKTWLLQAMAPDS